MIYHAFYWNKSSKIRLGLQLRQVPQEMDTQFEKLDPDSSLRPTIINVGRSDGAAEGDFHEGQGGDGHSFTYKCAFPWNKWGSIKYFRIFQMFLA